MTLADLRALVAEAMLAPSVHNVQPARWRIVGNDRLLLLEDLSRRLAVGDPRGNDAGISLGAAAEGIRLAAGRRGLALVDDATPLPSATSTLRPVAAYRVEATRQPADPLAALVDRRRSWRADFAPVLADDRAVADALRGEDSAVLSAPGALAGAASLLDRASFGFLRDHAFRRELLSWMRLSPRHPRWNADGLNAAAMAMGRIEAFGAGMVLGPLFRALDGLGLARPLVAEGGKVAKAAALVVFHRSADEAPFVSGAAFYRLWLRIEQAGLGGSVLAALADDTEAARAIAATAGVPQGRRVVSAFRVGRRPDGREAPRARLLVEDVLV